jgi:release factor glutamine methyltransferase
MFKRRIHPVLLILGKNKHLKIKEAYRETLNYLKEIYDRNEAKSVARLIFEDLGIRHLDIFISPDEILSSEKQVKLESIIDQALSKKPIQHILGYTWFYDRKFHVSPACLIPRQETEQIVDLVIKENRKFVNILDIGTGSGCIAISLKMNFEYSNVTGMDNSVKAMELAKQNASLYKANVRFIIDDIFNPDFSAYPGSLDLVVSNPPYVRESEKDMMDENVLAFEPKEALFVKDSDPLVYYKAIRNFCDQKLARSGIVYLEINEALATETAAIFNYDKRYSTFIIKDIHGKDRIIKSIQNE